MPASGSLQVQESPSPLDFDATEHDEDEDIETDTSLLTSEDDEDEDDDVDDAPTSHSLRYPTTWSPAPGYLPNELVLLILNYLAPAPPFRSRSKAKRPSPGKGNLEGEDGEKRESGRPGELASYTDRSSSSGSYLDRSSSSTSYLDRSSSSSQTSYPPPTLSRQNTLYSFVLVCRQWHVLGLPYLYASPHITARNFSRFISTICPSINTSIRPSYPARLIRRLDMSELTYHGSKSLTSRVLRRVRDELEVFVAPQATFAVTCLAALSKCQSLRELYLHLVSESIPAPNFFNSIAKLESLDTLLLPHSPLSNLDESFRRDTFRWPPRLSCLGISGSFRGKQIAELPPLPKDLKELSVAYCANLAPEWVSNMLLDGMGRNLTKFTVGYGVSNDIGNVAVVLYGMPYLKELTCPLSLVSASFISTAYEIAESNLVSETGKRLALSCLRILYDPQSFHRDPDLESCWDALETCITEGVLPCLERLELSAGIPALNAKLHKTRGVQCEARTSVKLVSAYLIHAWLKRYVDFKRQQRWVSVDGLTEGFRAMMSENQSRGGEVEQRMGDGDVDMNEEGGGEDEIDAKHTARQQRKWRCGVWVFADGFFPPGHVQGDTPLAEILVGSLDG